MRKIPTGPLILVALGIVVGSVGTFWVHIASYNKNSPTVDNHRSRAEGNESGTTFPAQAQKSVASEQLLLKLFENPASRTSVFQSKLDVYRHVYGLSEQQVIDALELSLSLEGVGSRRVLQELRFALLEKLVVVNPVEAVDFALKNQDLGFTSTAIDTRRPDLSGSAINDLVSPIVQVVFQEWAAIGLDAVINRARDLAEDEKKIARTGILATLKGESLSTFRTIARRLGQEDQGVEAYFSSLTRAPVDDPKTTWYEVVNYLTSNRSDRRYRVLQSVAQQWYKQEGFHILDEIRANSLDTGTKQLVMSTVFRAAAAENPEAAFRHAASLPDQGVFAWTLSSIVPIWAESDPQAAYQAVSNIEPESRKKALLDTVIHVWASNQPHDVLDKLDRFPQDLRKSAVSAAIGAIAKANPLEAAELALEQESTLLTLRRNIMRYWVQKNARGAEEWVFNGLVNDEVRHAWARPLIEELMHSNPRRAFKLALKQPISQGRALEERVMKHIVKHSDLDLAIELLPQVRPGDSRSAAYSHVGEKFIYLGNFQSAIELGAQLPVDEQTRFYQEIASPWAFIDADGLIETVKDFPDVAIRSSLLTYFLTMGGRFRFSEDQIDTVLQLIIDSE